LGASDVKLRKSIREASISRSFTGLEVDEFDALYPNLEPANSSFEEKRLQRSNRKRKAEIQLPTNTLNLPKKTNNTPRKPSAPLSKYGLSEVGFKGQI
jgi:hypothetical protein